MIFTEVPTRDLFDKARWWMPFAIKLAEYEGNDPNEYIWEAMRGEARVFVFWKDGLPCGALATRLMLYGSSGVRTGELHWIAGTGVLKTLSDWLPRIEQILIRDHAITRLNLTGREGWLRQLAPLGYRRRKVILEKGLETNV